jgi:hypothetical protein
VSVGAFSDYVLMIRSQQRQKPDGSKRVSISAPVAPMGKEFDPIKLKHSFMASSKLEAPLRS